MSVSDSNTILIWQVCVIEKYRKMGLGLMLIEKIYKIAKSENKKIQFTALENNLSSLHMFEKFAHKNNLTVNKIGKIFEGTDHEELIFQICAPLESY